MASIAVSGAHLAFSAYFLFRLLTVNPFLPKSRPHQSRIPRLHLILFFLLSSLPLIVRAQPFRHPAFAASWLLACLSAIRFAYNAPLFDYDTPDPPLLHYPRLFLWRLDILSYVLFVLARVAFTPPYSLFVDIVTIVLIITVVVVTAVDVLLRLQAQLIPLSIGNIFSALTAPAQRTNYLHEAPLTVYDAPAVVLLTFDWITQTIVTGRERPLEVADVIPLTDQYSSHVSASQRFMPHWQAQLDRSPAHRPSVGRALFKAFGLRLMLGGSLKALNDICLFISPLLLRSVSLSFSIFNLLFCNALISYIWTIILTYSYFLPFPMLPQLRLFNTFKIAMLV